MTAKSSQALIWALTDAREGLITAIGRAEQAQRCMPPYEAMDCENQDTARHALELMTEALHHMDGALAEVNSALAQA